MEPYTRAQLALAELKDAVYAVLESSPDGGLTNSQIGRSLGIYSGHVGHEGHISRTLLALMEAEGAVLQDPQTKRWSIRKHAGQDAERESSALTQPVS
jgi:hypothetical protein